MTADLVSCKLYVLELHIHVITAHYKAGRLMDIYKDKMNSSNMYFLFVYEHMCTCVWGGDCGGKLL